MLVEVEGPGWPAVVADEVLDEMNPAPDVLPDTLADPLSAPEDFGADDDGGEDSVEDEGEAWAKREEDTSIDDDEGFAELVVVEDGSSEELVGSDLLDMSVAVSVEVLGVGDEERDSDEVGVDELDDDSNPRASCLAAPGSNVPVDCTNTELYPGNKLLNMAHLDIKLCPARDDRAVRQGPLEGMECRAVAALDPRRPVRPCSTLTITACSHQAVECVVARPGSGPPWCRAYYTVIAVGRAAHAKSKVWALIRPYQTLRDDAGRLSKRVFSLEGMR